MVIYLLAKEIDNLQQSAIIVTFTTMIAETGKHAACFSSNAAAKNGIVAIDNTLCTVNGVFE